MEKCIVIFGMMLIEALAGAFMVYRKLKKDHKYQEMKEKSNVE